MINGDHGSALAQKAAPHGSGPAVLDKEAVGRLTASICAAATYQARSASRLIELIGELDAGGGLAHLHGAKSVAHWVSYACSMDPVTAREHVRIARALPLLPICAEAFRKGELSYSKMRALTRFAGLLDDAELCQRAQAATASQLIEMLSAYRRAKGSRIREEPQRRLTLTQRDTGMTQLTGELAAEDAAILDAAVQRALDLNGTPPEPEAANALSADDPVPDATPRYTTLDALLDICQHYLNTAETDDQSGEDRSLVMIEIAAEQLDNDQVANASAEASPRSGLCQLRGRGGIEPATAQRKLCTGSVLGAVVDRHGTVLALGRSRRLVSKAQRRALLIRDRSCQFPGCRQRRHLDAHHIVPWSHGGSTDLDNLILLCRFHHTCVHEGGVMINRRERPVYQGSLRTPDAWQFRMPDGELLAATGWRVRSADRLTRDLVAQLDRDEPEPRTVDHYDHPDAVAIRPHQCGEPFDLHACVRSLFDIELDHDRQPAA